ncbi:hypothetical protein LCGC14_2080870 [marine sediment metagenome]|uniref:Glycosyl hydrolase family 32 C-terminal domain-containing protein n=1 Tax=marine sediment metagenome TaxID=412755 RepID=A0A0F9EFX7_9ZZZZ
MSKKRTKGGTINFWCRPEKNPGAFTDGVNYNWGVYNINGRMVNVQSEGRALLATYNTGLGEDTLIFTQDLDIDTSKAHMITVTFSAKELNIYFDGQLQQALDIEPFD